MKEMMVGVIVDETCSLCTQTCKRENLNFLCNKFEREGKQRKEREVRKKDAWQELLKKIGEET